MNKLLSSQNVRILLLFCFIFNWRDSKDVEAFQIIAYDSSSMKEIWTLYNY